MTSHKPRILQVDRETIAPNLTSIIVAAFVLRAVHSDCANGQSRSWQFQHRQSRYVRVQCLNDVQATVGKRDTKVA